METRRKNPNDSQPVNVNKSSVQFLNDETVIWNNNRRKEKKINSTKYRFEKEKRRHFHSATMHRVLSIVYLWLFIDEQMSMKTGEQTLNAKYLYFAARNERGNKM